MAFAPVFQRPFSATFDRLKTMTAITLPRQPHTDFLARLRTIGLGLGGRGVMGLGLGRSRAGAATPWYLAGGAPMPVAAYQPIGAASLAASYVNLANPGTYDAAPGVAPTWASGTGWTFNGSTQYLTTGIYPSSAYSVLVRYSNSAVPQWGYLFGSVSPRYFGVRPIMPEGSPNWIVDYLWSVTEYKVGPGLAAGVLGLCANGGCRNGVLDSTVSGTFAANTMQMGLGGLGNGTQLYAGRIQAVAIWSSTLTEAQVAAVSAAMAAL